MSVTLSFFAPCFSLVSLFVGSSHAFAQTAQTAPPQSGLLLNTEEISALQQKIRSGEWVKRWQEYVKPLDQLLHTEVKLPPRGGNWSHNYVCPEHARALKRVKQIGEWEWEHSCPVGPHILRGDPSQVTLDFDGNAIMNEHDSRARWIRDLGVAWQVTGKIDYAKKAGEILDAYAEKYLSYPWHDHLGNYQKGKGGRVAASHLSEASWLIPLLQGADLVWRTLDPELQKRIETQLIRPAVSDVIFPNKGKIHNIQCWHDAAIGLAGYLLGDQEWITFALDDPENGMRQQLEQGINPDGMWYEGSSSYHSYTLMGMWPLLVAASHHGVDLFQDKLRSMFDAPLHLAMPNLVLPNFNDSTRVNLSGMADYYDLAYAKWRAPDYLLLLRNAKRSGNLALWFGVSSFPPENGAVEFGSRNSVSSGYAILEQGKGRDATWLCLKYGPHGGSHGHYDKNHFILYSRGQVLMPDSGMHLYSSPLHKIWDKNSLAHNVLVIDERDQEKATGRSVAFGNQSGVDYSITEAGAIYPGVKHYRTVALLDPNIIVVVDQVQTAEKHTMDLACHFAGEWTKRPDGSDWTVSDQPAYQQFQNMLRHDGSKGFDAVLKTADGGKTRVVVMGGEPTEVITGDAPGESTVDRVPALLMRRETAATAFLWAVSLDGEAIALETIPVNHPTGKPASEAVGLQISARGKSWLLAVQPDSTDPAEIFQVVVR